MILLYFSNKKIKYGSLRLHYLFLCPFCYNKVERIKDVGLRQESCGCCTSYLRGLKISKHSEAKKGKETRLYQVWKNMKERCLNKNCKSYLFYGAKNIIICKEWKDYIPFRNWAFSNGYQENLTIDRINNKGNYEPKNCRWVTIQENFKNRKIKLTQEDVNDIREKHMPYKYTLSRLAKEYDVSPQTISSIIRGFTWKYHS